MTSFDTLFPVGRKNAPQNTPLANGPITDNERAWVARALRHRRLGMRLRQVQFWQTGVFLSALIPLPILLLDRLEDTPFLSAAPQGRYIALGLIAFGLVFFALFCWIHFWRIRPLAAMMNATVPDDLWAKPMHGSITVHRDEELFSGINSGGVNNVPIQIPPHWATRLNGHSYQIRVAQVDATDKVVTVRSIIRRGMGSTGAVFTIPVTSGTFADAKYVLLAAGPMCVHSEVEAGLGLPALQSGAWMQMALHWAVGAAVFAFFSWVATDHFAQAEQAFPTILAGCALIQLVWFVPLVRRALARRRYDAFYAAP